MKVTSATEQPTRRGGQASLSLFGVGGINSKLAPHMARPNPAPARPATRKPWTSRIKGALNPGDRDGLSPAPVVTVAARHAAPLKAAITTSFPPLARPYDPTFNEAEYRAWLDEILVANRVWQARQADTATDEYDGYGLARPSTPAMQRAAVESDRHQEREWREYADLVAFYPTLPYGSVETACALND